MRRYELIDGASQKFWKICLKGEQVKSRWARRDAELERQFAALYPFTELSVCEESGGTNQRTVRRC